MIRESLTFPYIITTAPVPSQIWNEGRTAHPFFAIQQQRRAELQAAAQPAPDAAGADADGAAAAKQLPRTLQQLPPAIPPVHVPAPPPAAQLAPWPQRQLLPAAPAGAAGAATLGGRGWGHCAADAALTPDECLVLAPGAAAPRAGDASAAAAAAEASLRWLLAEEEPSSPPSGGAAAAGPSPASAAAAAQPHSAARDDAALCELFNYLNRSRGADSEAFDEDLEDEGPIGGLSLGALRDRLQAFRERRAAAEAAAQAPAAGAAGAGAEANALWTARYAPGCSGEVCGNTQGVSALRKWLADWKERISAERDAATATGPAPRGGRGGARGGARGGRRARVFDDSDDDFVSDDGGQSDSDDGVGALAGGGDGLATALIVGGPTGCGKTAGVHACARELGFKVLEIAANSTMREGADIMESFGEATQSQRLTTRGGGASSLFSGASRGGGASVSGAAAAAAGAPSSSGQIEDLTEDSPKRKPAGGKGGKPAAAAAAAGGGAGAFAKLFGGAAAKGKGKQAEAPKPPTAPPPAPKEKDKEKPQPNPKQQQAPSVAAAATGGGGSGFGTQSGAVGSANEMTVILFDEAVCFIFSSFPHCIMLVSDPIELFTALALFSSLRFHSVCHVVLLRV